jgi:tetratricopeptide (TPR) repeat protein
MAFVTGALLGSSAADGDIMIVGLWKPAIQIFAFLMIVSVGSAAEAAPREHQIPQEPQPSARYSQWKSCTEGSGEAARAACRRIGAASSGYPAQDRATAKAILGDYLLYAKKAQEALVHYDAALDLMPNMASAHYYRGRALVDLSRQDEALAAYDRALIHRPHYLNVRVFRAQLYLMRKAHDLAHADLDRADAIDPKDPRISFHRARIYSDQKRWKESLTASDTAINLDPDDKNSYYNRAGARWNLSDREGALADVTVYLSKDPDDKEALQRRSFYLRNMGRSKEALLDATKLLAVAGDDAWSWYNMALVQKKLEGEGKDKALGFYERAIAMAPTNVTYRIDKIDFLIDQSKYDAAAVEAQATIDIAPDDVRGHRELGRSFILAGKAELARIPLATALKIDPKSNDVNYWLGREAYSSKRYQEALLKFENVRKITPEFEIVYYYIAEVERNLEKYNDSVLNYEEYIKRKPNDSDGYLGKGLAIYELRKYKEAAEIFKVGLDLNKDSKNLTYWYLAALADDGQDKKAISEIEQYELRTSLNSEIKLVKINVLNNLNRPDEALAAIEAFPKDTKLQTIVFFQKGRALHGSNPAEAIKAYQASIDAEPKGIYAAYAYANQAEVHYALGNWDSGARAFEKAIGLKPSERDFQTRWTTAKLASGDLSDLGEASAGGLKKTLGFVTEGLGSILERLTDKLQQLPKPSP